MATERNPDTAYASSETSTKTRSRANLNVISHPRGRPRVLLRVLEEVVDVVDSPIAAAALTLAYKLAYGNSDDCSESGTDQQDNEIDSDNQSDFHIAEGLVFSDNEEILLDDVSDDDLFRSSFPKNNSVSKYYLESGPQPPDLSQYPEEDHNDVWAAFKKKRKAYNDKQRYTKAKIARNNPNCNESRYTGCNSDQLQPMTEVEAGPLLVNHTFSSKDILHLRIAEEANLRGIVIRVTRSDDQNFHVIGVDFYVRASFTQKDGWKVLSAVCREGGDLLTIPPTSRVYANKDGSGSRSLTTPLKSKMIVPIIMDAIRDNPGMPYPLLREILKPYAQDYSCTDSLLQEGRELAKAQLFGRAEDNVKYARAVKVELRSLGHHVKLLFAERKQVRLAQCLTRRLISREYFLLRLVRGLAHALVVSQQHTVYHVTTWLLWLNPV